MVFEDRSLGFCHTFEDETMGEPSGGIDPFVFVEGITRGPVDKGPLTSIAGGAIGTEVGPCGSGRSVSDHTGIGLVHSITIPSSLYYNEVKYLTYIEINT